ncbi:MAG: hypothetical protein GXP49_07805 [Deltaproteobacteria bacterium]|nr:hypothetical protein [Deltaproteobacteria bacterium]
MQTRPLTRMWIFSFFVLCYFLPHMAVAGDFMDVRLSFKFFDDDFLHDSKDGSPGIEFGRDDYLLPSEAFGSKYTGRETQARLVLYKKLDDLWPRLVTEAAIVLRYNVFVPESGKASNAAVGVEDDGSYIRVAYAFDDSKKPPSLALVLFPFSSDRFRLGYTYDITWGGPDAFIEAQRVRPTTGAKLEYKNGENYAFVGAKSTEVNVKRIGQGEISTPEVRWGGLAGGGYDILDMVLLEAGCGYFNRGAFTRENPVMGKPMHSWGISARATYHLGQKVGLPVDFRLYRNNPEAIEEAVKPEKQASFGLMAGIEYTHLEQVLIDPVVSGGTSWQPANAGNIFMRLRLWNFRVTLDMVYRDVAFLQFDQPSFETETDFHPDFKLKPELFAVAGVDYHFESIHVTPGLLLSYQRPASVSLPSLKTEGMQPIEKPTVVVRNRGDWDILPAGDSVTAILSSKLTLKVQLSSMLTVLAEAYLAIDNNKTRYTLKGGDSNPATWTRIYQDPYIFGAGIIFFAKF